MSWKMIYGLIACLFANADKNYQSQFMRVKVLARHTCEFIGVHSVLYNNSFNDLHNQHNTY